MGWINPKTISRYWPIKKDRMIETEHRNKFNPMPVNLYKYVDLINAENPKKISDALLSSVQ